MGVRPSKSTTLILLAMSLAGPAHGQSDSEIASQISPQLRACESDPQNGGTLQQALCYAREDARQERLLNEAWRRIPPSRRAALRAGERRWIRQRDAKCRAVAADSINSTANYMFAMCVADETIRRRIWLDRAR